MEGNSIKTLQNLCKIFEMKIKIDNAKGDGISDEVISNYEKYAQKIDAYYNEEFQKRLKDLISPKNNLEDERERLEELISLLEDRLEKRSTLAGDFHSNTGKYIKNLQLIVSESELNNKKERLEHITKYLDITKEIENIEIAMEKLKEELTEEETKKEEYLEKNKVLEDELYSSFVTSVSRDDYYGNIEEENIIDILNEVSKKAKETKETLDITKESVDSLLSSGMDDEYESYVEEANKNYSLWKDREIILKIYKLVINFEDAFKDVLLKRETINNLLEERKGINIGSDILLSFENVMLEQSTILKNEKEILENITNLTSRIEFKEERLKELEEVVKEPEILTILSEYNLANMNEKEENIDIIDEKNSLDIPSNIENIVIKEYNPYQIISIDDYPNTLNVGLAKLKGTSVRDKVNKKLNSEVNIPEFHIGVIPDDKILNNNVNNENNPSDITLNSEENIIPEINDNQNDINNTIPVFDTENTMNNEVTNNVEETSNNSFWIPVSDSNLEENAFPNIEIVNTENNLNNNIDNFGFPEVDN